MITFGLEDLRTPERMERVLRLFEHEIRRVSDSGIGASAAVEKQVVRLADRTSAPQIGHALSSVGDAPLNVEGLLGVLAQPQKSAVPSGTALPDVQTSQDGELFMLNQVLYRFDATTEPGVWRVVGAAAAVIVDTAANFTAANYPPANYPLGTLFWVSDRTVLYMIQSVAGSNAWVYVLGTMRGTLSPDQKPAGLGTNGTGFLFYSTDFDHVFRWTGAAWAMAPGETPQGEIGLFTIAPGTGWQLCDGTATTRSTATGGTAAVTVPSYGSGPYIKASTVLTVGPTGAGGSTTTEAAHTHPIDHDHGAEAFVSGNNSATQEVQSGLGTIVAANPHTHSVTVDLAPFVGTSGTGGAHSHGPSTLELLRTELLAYYRL